MPLKRRPTDAAASVEIEILEEVVDNKPLPIKIKVYRSLLKAYASNFALVFEHPGVRGAKLEGVEVETVLIFIAWMRKEYERSDPNSRAEQIEWEKISTPRDWHTCSSLHPELTEYGGDHFAIETCVDMFFFAETYDIPALR